MHGLIHRILKDLVVEKFGIEPWAKITAELGLKDDTVFLELRQHEDSWTLEAISATAGALNETLEGTLFIFGGFFVEYVYRGGYLRLLESMGDPCACLGWVPQVPTSWVDGAIALVVQLGVNLESPMCRIGGLAGDVRLEGMAQGRPRGLDTSGGGRWRTRARTHLCHCSFILCSGCATQRKCRGRVLSRWMRERSEPGGDDAREGAGSGWHGSGESPRGPRVCAAIADGRGRARERARDASEWT